MAGAPAFSNAPALQFTLNQYTPLIELVEADGSRVQSFGTDVISGLCEQQVHFLKGIIGRRWWLLSRLSSDQTNLTNREWDRSRTQFCRNDTGEGVEKSVY